MTQYQPFWQYGVFDVAQVGSPKPNKGRQTEIARNRGFKPIYSQTLIVDDTVGGEH